MARNSYASRNVAVAILTIAWGQITTLQAAEARDILKMINHIVVIYQENHSFDNLYGLWEGVDGLGNAHVAQTDQERRVLRCLPQNDVNLAAVRSSAVPCSDPARGINTPFANAPFPIDAFITDTDTTCPRPGTNAANGIRRGEGQPGGCTRDLVHRFYQEQFQIDGGRMDRYVAGSDALGLAMGYYDTTNLPVYKYLHRTGHPRYVIADNFFQAAFGGSLLNHQWLIAARTPQWIDAVNDGSSLDQHSVVDTNGMPAHYPFYNPPAGAAVLDEALTVSCAPAATRGPTPAGVVCGNFVVNTIQPMAWPYKPLPAGKSAKEYARMRLPSLTTPTIGDRLTAAGIDWAWYSGGWANTEGDPTQPGYTNQPRYTRPGDTPRCPASAFEEATWPKCPDKLFQFHHQPFNYFANYAPGTVARNQHLRDEEEFIELARASGTQRCELRPVSFVKPLGVENEHPGYASEHVGDQHLVGLIEAIAGADRACARDTMIIVAYDEYGGQADHVMPPGPGNSKGPYDRWGPGTRIPVLIIAPHLANDFAIDHAVHDTTSILATIEHRYGLTPLGSRDAQARDLTTVFEASGANAAGGE
jgi:acid phosphatase